MQSHFVVMYDHETGKFYLDNESTEVKFSDGNMWDTEKEEWVDPQEVVQLNVMDGFAYLLLNELLEKKNDTGSKNSSDVVEIETWKCGKCGTDCSAVTCPEAE